MQPGQLPARPIAWTATQPAMRRALDNRALTRWLSQARIRALRCSRRGCFVCISCVLDALPEQCLRCKPDSYFLVAAVFRTKRLLHKRCAAKCLRRRRPGQVRRRQGRLQITAVRRVDDRPGRVCGRAQIGLIWLTHHPMAGLAMMHRVRHPCCERPVPAHQRGHRQAEALASSISVIPVLIACSPFLRARQTAEPLRARFPSAASVSLPIQEFTYLAPASWRGTTARRNCRSVAGGSPGTRPAAAGPAVARRRGRPRARAVSPRTPAAG